MTQSLLQSILLKKLETIEQKETIPTQSNPIIQNSSEELIHFKVNCSITNKKFKYSSKKNEDVSVFIEHFSKLTNIKYDLLEDDEGYVLLSFKALKIDSEHIVYLK
jgi:hypothetical protein